LPPASVRNGKNAAVRLEAIEERIRELALSFPEAYEDRPWGDFPVFKVGANKVFGWAVLEDGAVHVTVKLTAEERDIAHLLPYVRTARYVGRYGWITAAVTDDEVSGGAEGRRRGRARRRLGGADQRGRAGFARAAVVASPLQGRPRPAARLLRDRARVTRPTRRCDRRREVPKYPARP
jgi:predicted DNA-binding protein (MmcQ/YjbR family)